jgi:hypothetical protein
MFLYPTAMTADFLHIVTSPIGATRASLVPDQPGVASLSGMVIQIPQTRIINKASMSRLVAFTVA